MSRRFIAAWTDYPIAELGDTPGQRAPIRAIEILSWDRNKYVVIEVEGVRKSIKAGYCYPKPGRCPATPVTHAALNALPPSDRAQAKIETIIAVLDDEVKVEKL